MVLRTWSSRNTVHRPGGDKVRLVPYRGKVTTVVIVAIVPIPGGNDEVIVRPMCCEELGNSLCDASTAGDPKSATFAKVILNIDD